MNAFKVITALNIGLLQKLELIALMADIKSVARVDIFSCNENFKQVT